MSVSVDTKKIEALKQLESVLGLLQNPESYTRLLAEVQVTLRQLEEATKRYATVEAAEKYLQDAQRLLAETKDTTIMAAKKLVVDKTEFEAGKAVALQGLADREAKAKQREDRVELAEKSVQAEAVELQKMKAEFQQYRDTQRSALTNKSEELDRMKKDLSDKLSRLARIAAE